MTPLGAEVDLGTHGNDLALTPDGKFLYVANTQEGTLSQFAINADGTATALSPATVAATFPRSPLVTADGRFLLAIKSNGKGPASNFLSVLAVGGDGKLTPP